MSDHATLDAYNAVCVALEKHRADIERATAEAIAAWLDEARQPTHSAAADEIRAKWCKGQP